MILNYIVSNGTEIAVKQLVTHKLLLCMILLSI